LQAACFELAAQLGQPTAHAAKANRKKVIV
jgi:hypothetical protein